MTNTQRSYQPQAGSSPLALVIVQWVLAGVPFSAQAGNFCADESAELASATIAAGQPLKQLRGNVDELDWLLLGRPTGIEILNRATLASTASKTLPGDLVSHTQPLKVSSGEIASYAITSAGNLHKIVPLNSADEWAKNLQPGACTSASLGAVAIQQKRDSGALFNAEFGADVVFAGTLDCNGTANKVYAVGAATGVIEWVFNSGPTQTVDDIRGLVVDPASDTLYFVTDRSSTSNDSVWALNTRDGSVRWSANVGQIWAAPVLHGGRLYVAELSGKLHALNPATGATDWTLDNSGIPFADAPVVGDLDGQRRIFIRDYFGELHAATETGAAAAWDWHTAIPAVTAPSGPLLLDLRLGRLYTGSDNGLLYTLDVGTGSIMASRTIGGSSAGVGGMHFDRFADGDATLVVSTSDGVVKSYCAGEPLYRDSIGLDRRRVTLFADPDFASHSDTASPAVSAVTHQIFPGPTGLSLTGFEVLVAGSNPCSGNSACFENMSFELMAWPDATAISDPLGAPGAGKLFQIDVTSRLTIAPDDNEIFDVATFTNEPAMRLAFDLTGLGANCPASGCLIALMGRGDTTADGLFRPVYFVAGADADEDSYVPDAATVQAAPEFLVRMYGAPARPVQIDVLPGDAANVVYPNQAGRLPVALLSAVDFDATQVDPASLRLGVGEAPLAEGPVYSDVDGSHGTDLTARYPVPETGIFCNDTEVMLTGQTYAGELVAGSDMIDASQCEEGGCHAY